MKQWIEISHTQKRMGRMIIENGASKRIVQTKVMNIFLRSW